MGRARAIISDGAEGVGIAQGLPFGVMKPCWAVGALVGPAAGGALADATGDAVPYLVMAAICLATLVAAGSRAAPAAA